MYGGSRTTRQLFTLSDEQEEEYRELIQDFVSWCDSNHLILNITKTKEMVVDLRRQPKPAVIKGDCLEVVKTYKYLRAQLDDKLVCQHRRSVQKAHRALAVCSSSELQIFYQSVVVSALRYAVVCCGTELNTLTSWAEQRTLNRFLSIIDNTDHRMYSTTSRHRGSFSDRLLSLSCSTDRLGKSFLPHAIRHFNTHR